MCFKLEGAMEAISTDIVVYKAAHPSDFFIFVVKQTSAHIACRFE